MYSWGSLKNPPLVTRDPVHLLLFGIHRGELGIPKDFALINIQHFREIQGLPFLQGVLGTAR